MAAGCIGILTVADDFDHTGELFSVAGILVAGLVLLIDGSNVFFSRRLALHWVAIGIGVGEVVGAIAGSLPTGVSGGALLGTFGAALFGPRRR